MTHWDVFNGDADGVIALLQLRLADPIESQLITGVKRDIKLLGRVKAQPGDLITVLDISMEKNQGDLELVLISGAKVRYFDHHRSGQIPEHPCLSHHIDLSADTCTSLLVDRFLAGRFHLWAITAAYGDNLISTADNLAQAAGLTIEQTEHLKQLGILLNYNGYGQSVEDLHIHPADLFKQLLQYKTPFEVIEDKNSIFYLLKGAYQEDIQLAQAAECIHESTTAAVFKLPHSAWSRRVSGVWGNELANRAPQRAHGVVTDNGDDTYTVSVRAPLENKTGADEVCIQFATGGGRAAAAGINRLPKEQLIDFCQTLEKHYQ